MFQSFCMFGAELKSNAFPILLPLVPSAVLNLGLRRQLEAREANLSLVNHLHLLILSVVGETMLVYLPWYHCAIACKN